MTTIQKGLCWLVWLFILFCPLAPAAEAAPPALSGEDFVIPDMSWLEIHQQISVRQLADYLGEEPDIETFQYDEPGILCKFTTVQVWLTGTVDPHEPAAVVRVLISDPKFVTHRGLRVGQKEERIFARYGQKPGYTSTIRNLTWHRYFADNSLERIIFAVDSEGNIAYIGFSCTAGGL